MQAKRNITFEVFDTFADAEKAQRDEYARMTPAERIHLTELLRSQYYGYEQAGTEPRFERTFASIEKSQC